MMHCNRLTFCILSGDCLLNPYPTNESPFPLTVYYDSTNTKVTNASCNFGGAKGIYLMINTISLNTLCPSAGKSWKFPLMMCVRKYSTTKITSIRFAILWAVDAFLI